MGENESRRLSGRRRSGTWRLHSEAVENAVAEVLLDAEIVEGFFRCFGEVFAYFEDHGLAVPGTDQNFGRETVDGGGFRDRHENQVAGMPWGLGAAVGHREEVVDFDVEVERDGAPWLTMW